MKYLLLCLALLSAPLMHADELALTFNWTSQNAATDLPASLQLDLNDYQVQQSTLGVFYRSATAQPSQLLFDGTDLWVLDSAGPYSILYDFTFSQAIDPNQLAPGMNLSFSGSEIAANRDTQALTMSELDGVASASTLSGLSPLMLESLDSVAAPEPVTASYFMTGGALIALGSLLRRRRPKVASAN